MGLGPNRPDFHQPVSGACSSISTLTIYSGTVSDFVVDGSAVYFLDSGSGTVSSLPKTGGAATTLASGLGSPRHIAQDSSFLYWTNYLGGSVMRLPKSGGTPTVIASAAQPTQLQVDDCNVYWYNSLDYTVRKREKSGGGATTTLYTMAAPMTTPFFEQNATSLFLKDVPCSYCEPTIIVLPKSGAPKWTITTTCGYAGAAWFHSTDLDGSLWVCGNTVYADGAVLWSDYPGFFGPAAGPIVQDGADLYFANFVGVRRIQRCANRWPALVVDVPAAQLALDATHVFFSDGKMVGRVLK